MKIRLELLLLTVLAFLAPPQSDAMIRQSALPDMYAPATCLADDARTPIFEETPEYVAYLVETGDGRYWVICPNALRVGGGWVWRDSRPPWYGGGRCG